jgi:AraC-like DNA-binding protein
MFAYARTSGVDVDAVLRELELSQKDLETYDTRIPESLRARAWVEVSRRSGDPLFGLRTGASARLGDFDALGYALLFSATLGDGLERIMRFHRVLCDAWAIAPEETSRGLRLRRIERTPPAEADSAFAFLVLRAHELTGRSHAPRGVWFMHAPPDDRLPYDRVFRCPVHFGAAANVLELDRSVSSMPIRSANPGAAAVLDRYMAKDLAKLPSSASFVEHVRAAISRSLHDAEQPSLATMARALRCSSRTLQRRLLELGTSYREVLDGVRRELAERLLSEGGRSVTEVAFLTGFEDVSGFRRRYRGWTGRSPSQRAGGR